MEQARFHDWSHAANDIDLPFVRYKIEYTPRYPNPHLPPLPPLDPAYVELVRSIPPDSWYDGKTTNTTWRYIGNYLTNKTQNEVCLAWLLTLIEQTDSPVLIEALDAWKLKLGALPEMVRSTGTFAN